MQKRSENKFWTQTTFFQLFLFVFFCAMKFSDFVHEVASEQKFKLKSLLDNREDENQTLCAAAAKKKPFSYIRSTAVV